MTALIAGERNPTTLAELARTRMRTKIGQLEEAFTGAAAGCGPPRPGQRNAGVCLLGA